MFTLNCRGRFMVIDKPVVMGIVNVTIDSFYSSSQKPTTELALQQAEKMINEGALILDIGGQSTRPGSKKIGEAEEAQRVLPVIEAISKNFPSTFISIDTYYASVAKQAVDAGACIVNDISGGNFDINMLATVASLHVPYICMHIQGTPETMHEKYQYENVTKEVLDYFIRRIDVCRETGIHDIMIDVGFGFSKNASQNFELLRNLSVFKMLEKPILLGVSRKSTIYKTLGITAEEALNGTTVLNTIGLLNGANILRVHDVKEAVETIKMLQAYRN